MDNQLIIQNVHVSVDDKEIIKDLSLTCPPGQVAAIMGQNGSGKSSLAYAIMGHPNYTVTRGSITFDGVAITDLSPDKRARYGIFLAMQAPCEVEGVLYKDFLRSAYNALYDGTERQLRLGEFKELLAIQMALVKVDETFIHRPINVGFSGGEKKRAEILQLAVLQPKLAILDEVDSGLDVDALKSVCTALNSIRQEHAEMTVIIITHYQRLLDYIAPDRVYVMHKGRIVQTGDKKIAEEIEERGYLVQQ